MAIVKVNNISKKFGTHQAVDNISFEVEEGLICGILGPNGAGKSTTIRMINNIIQPDTGSIEIFGDKLKSESQDYMGYLPEERGLYKRIKVIDQLTYFGKLKSLSDKEAKERARYWLDRLEASDWENKKIQELSKGMQQKVQFISTIMHKPRLLILDEPFSGFDPINADLFKRIVLELKDEGTTVLFSTHIMEHAEQMCDQIGLINKGKMVLFGNLRSIKKEFGRDTILMEYEEGDDTFLNDFSGLSFINRSKGRVEFRVVNKDIKVRDILAKANENVEIINFQLSEPSLNEIFIETVSKTGESNVEL